MIYNDRVFFLQHFNKSTWYTWTTNQSRPLFSGKRKDHSSVALSIHPPTQYLVVFRWSSSSSHQSIKRESLVDSESLLPSNSYSSSHSIYILMVDSYSNLSWLVWIQMFVFFLLLLLLCVFGLLSSDISESSVSSSADSLPSTSASRRFLSGDPIPISHHHALGFSVVQSNQVNS